MYLDFCLNYKQNRITRSIMSVNESLSPNYDKRGLWFLISGVRCALDDRVGLTKQDERCTRILIIPTTVKD